MQNSDSNAAFMKGPKRKRLAKACDACHKSKRRCDGTAPCSNCYYATKQCTYTDASGRAVPAPRSFKPEGREPQASSSSSGGRPHPPSHYDSSSSNQFRIYLAQSSTDNDDEHKHDRKRLRNEKGHPIPVGELIIEGPISGVAIDRPASIELDPSLTRELTNLFFTHCNPARTVIHKPTFSTNLSHNRVPSHLLLAVCALAAPLSKQPRIRTTPSRFAGKPFAEGALSQMFEPGGRLIVDPNLETAQALCILQMHDILTNERNAQWRSRFHDLALQIVEGLGVHSPEHPTLTPVPSAEFVQGSIERESLRRIFWLIHVLDVLASIFFKKPPTFSDNELRLRLPVDETSYELGVHSTLPEYLYLQAVRTQYASEFGHLIRILSIYANMEFILDDGNGTFSILDVVNPILLDVSLNIDQEAMTENAGALMDAERKLEEWDRTLPDHLRFSESSLQVQRSMFETSSNTGAWCWCSIHVFHASCTLALNSARQRNQRGQQVDRQWALERIESILNLLGDRAKNTILMGSALWSLIKYCKRDDQQVRKWAAEYEEATGTRIFDFVQEWRSQPSPPLQHQHLSHMHLQHQQTHPHPTLSYNMQRSLPHRRLSDVRTSGSPGNIALNTAPPSYDENSPAGHSVKRSPDHSPQIYPLGRSSNNTTNNNTSASNRNLSLNQQPVSLNDTPVTGGANSGKETRSQQSLNASGLGVIGSLLSHGTLDDVTQGNDVKYSNRESSSNQSRWINSSRESALSRDGGMHAAYSGSNGLISGTPKSLPDDGNRMSNSGQSLSGAGTGSNNAGLRSFSILGEGSQSLPSLKASGLLDSWNPSRNNVDLQKPTVNSAGPQSYSQSSRSGRMSPPRTNIKVTSTPVRHSDGTDLRASSTLPMPVGMPWLANESR